MALIDRQRYPRKQSESISLFPAITISGAVLDLVFWLIGLLSYDLIVLWKKQADDDDGTLMRQKNFGFGCR